MAAAWPSNNSLVQFAFRDDNKFDLKVMGFVKSPHKDTFMYQLTYFTRFLVTVTPMTTIRHLKNVVLDRYKLLTYEQIDIDCYTPPLSDYVTVKDLMNMYPNFQNERFLRFTIIFPGKMFSQIFGSFKEMGMTEENALIQTKSFMETVHNKESMFNCVVEASPEEIARRTYAKFECDSMEQDRLTEVMWTSLTFNMSGLQMNNDGPNGNTGWGNSS